LSRELAVRANNVVKTQAELDSSPTLRDYINTINKSFVIDQLDDVSKDWRLGSRVLDVGFGCGISSLYLASIGFSIVGVEPSQPDIDIAFKASQ